jgi:excisionase family DNA binding protein
MLAGMEATAINQEPALGSPERWVTKRELAAHLGMSERWIELRVRDGMPSVRFGRSRRFLISEVEAWLREES